jgi:hypothetical protein
MYPVLPLPSRLANRSNLLLSIVVLCDDDRGLPAMVSVIGPTLGALAWSTIICFIYISAGEFFFNPHSFWSSRAWTFCVVNIQSRMVRLMCNWWIHFRVQKWSSCEKGDLVYFSVIDDRRRGEEDILIE